MFTKSFDPGLISGWGKRTYNWEMGVSVQQEVMPRLGLTVGYFRRWFGPRCEAWPPTSSRKRT